MVIAPYVHIPELPDFTKGQLKAELKRRRKLKYTVTSPVMTGGYGYREFRTKKQAEAFAKKAKAKVEQLEKKPSRKFMNLAIEGFDKTVGRFGDKMLMIPFEPAEIGLQRFKIKVYRVI